MPAQRRRARIRWAVLLSSLIATMAGCGVPAGLPTPPGTASAVPGTGTSAPATAGATPGSASPAPGPRVLLDEPFDGTKLDTKVWNTCHWWNDDGCTIASNDELEWYRPEGVRVGGGALQLVAEPTPQHGSDGRTYPYRSGMVTTGPAQEHAPAKLAFTYGTVTARLKVPTGKGLWSAMWLLPADEQSRPEIDVMEILGNDPTRSIMHLHPAGSDRNAPTKTVTVPGVDFSAGWHTFQIDWTAGRLDYLIDGRRVWRVSGSQVPSTPMYLVFDLAVGGVYPGAPSAQTRFPATLAVDHVTITAPR